MSKSRSEAKARAAFQAGQQSGQHIRQTGSQVIVTGDVRNHQILYSEGLTLNQAIVQAEYTGSRHPSMITVIRAGQRYDIEPKSLLRGQQDPLLEPGDLVEIRR